MVYKKVCKTVQVMAFQMVWRLVFPMVSKLVVRKAKLLVILLVSMMGLWKEFLKVY